MISYHIFFMYEFEKKFRITGVSYEMVHKVLSGISETNPLQKTQSDEIFSLTVSSVSWEKDSQFFRIRQVEDTSVLTLKTIGKDTNSFQEFETLISDPYAVRSMLQSVGYHSLVHLQKNRTIYRIDSYHICLDDLKDIGLFMEIEIVQSTRSSPDFSDIIETISRALSDCELTPESANYVMLALDAKQNKE